jgi:DNA replication licensing factor MCM6
MNLGAEEDEHVAGLEESFMNFLMTFNPSDFEPTAYEIDGEPQERNYMQEKVQEMASGGSTTLFIDFEHLKEYSYDMSDMVLKKYERAEPVLRSVVRDYVRLHHPAYLHEAHGTEKQFFVGVTNMQSTEKLRDLRVEKIGELVSFSGTVTRTSEVRPELFLGTFKCQNCAHKIRNVEQINKFTQPMICPENGCNNRCGAERPVLSDLGHTQICKVMMLKASRL